MVLLKRFLMVCSMVFVFIGFTNVAYAGTYTQSGTLVAGSDPTMPVMGITDPNCTLQAAFLVTYHTIPFTVSADGVYTFTLISDGGFASIYIFEESIALANCVMGSNVDPVSEVATLTAGVQYLAVPFDDTFAQLGGNYTLEISGPGEITEPYSGPVLDELGNLVYPCDYPMPTTAVLYDVPQGAPAFFDADLSTQVNFNLPAGQWKVMEFSGDFARVWITCGGSPVWIPTNALGVALE